MSTTNISTKCRANLRLLSCVHVKHAFALQIAIQFFYDPMLEMTKAGTIDSQATSRSLFK
jgi:hypothetical protein